MSKRILWIEDDYYTIKGLVKPLENDGFCIDIAIDGIEAYKKLTSWQAYDLIVGAISASTPCPGAVSTTAAKFIRCHLGVRVLVQFREDGWHIGDLGG